MIPFANETVTLVRSIKDLDECGRAHTRFAKFKLTGCSWRRKEIRTASGGEILRSEVITCRIPVDQQRPSPGDCLFLGEVAEEVTDTVQRSEALAAHRDAGAFIVTAVKDNARPGYPLPHWAAEGEA